MAQSQHGQAVTSLPKTSAELVKALDGLSYRQRISYVARLASTHKNDPRLTTLITGLRDVREKNFYSQ